jgi:hypothetical protein
MSEVEFHLCPKSDACNAPCCPVDSKWNRRAVLNDDSICYYLLESAKDGAQARFEGAGLGEFYRRVVAVSPLMQERFSRIRRKVSDAAKSGSRMERRFPQKEAGDD